MKPMTFLNKCRAAQAAFEDLLAQCGATSITAVVMDDGRVELRAFKSEGEFAQADGDAFEDAAYDLLFRAQGLEPLPF